MRKRLAIALSAVALTVAMVPGLASAGNDAPNQGNPEFVETVKNPFFKYEAECLYYEPGPKIEGDLGHFLFVYSPYKPIYMVTIKSGRDNEVGGYFFHYGKKAKIWSEKDISNYVVWVCKRWELTDGPG